MERLHKIDHLPVSRDLILSWILLPGLVTVAVGYGAGRVAEGMRTPGEAILFENMPANYGLKVPVELFDLIGHGPAPQVTAPWGETHEMMTVPVVKGLPWRVHKPYTTPQGASRDFVAWQISRAVADLYGADVHWQEIAERYLVTDISGLVLVREPGLTLVADNPGLRARGDGPVFPILFGTLALATFLVSAGFFCFFRPGVTIRRGRWVFWPIMAGLFLLHISVLVAFVAGISDGWLLEAVVFGKIRDLGKLGAVGHLAAWVGMGLLTFVAWWVAGRRFQRVEAPRT